MPNRSLMTSAFTGDDTTFPKRGLFTDVAMTSYDEDNVYCSVRPCRYAAVGRVP